MGKQSLCISIIILIIIIILIVIICYSTTNSNNCNTITCNNKNNFYGSSVINSNICAPNQITKLNVNYVTSNGNICANTNTNCAKITSISCVTNTLTNKNIIANITSMVTVSKNASTRNMVTRSKYKQCPLGSHIGANKKCSPNNLSTIATRAENLYQRRI